MFDLCIYFMVPYTKSCVKTSREKRAREVTCGLVCIALRMVAVVTEGLKTVENICWRLCCEFLRAEGTAACGRPGCDWKIQFSVVIMIGSLLVGPRGVGMGKERENRA